MKQGLKIILFVLPQLFALFVKTNMVFSAPDFAHHQTSLSHLSDNHFSNVVVADSFKEYELEFEDYEFSDYFSLDSSKEIVVRKQNRIIDSQKLNHGYHTKLYILYSSFKLHC